MEFYEFKTARSLEEKNLLLGKAKDLIATIFSQIWDKNIQGTPLSNGIGENETIGSYENKSSNLTLEKWRTAEHI